MKKQLITIMASLFLATSALAGQFGVGVSGSIAAIAATGTESETTNTGTENSIRTANASENAFIGSVFAEYSLDNGFTLGVDYIPGSADVNSKSITRTDVTADANEGVQDDGDRTANAEVENHITIYAEVPLQAGLYVKGGYIEMDVITKDSSTVTTSTQYGNKTVDGIQYGLGYKNSFGNNGFYKVEASHSDFDTLSLTSTGAENTIKADLDITKATFALGYNF